MCHITYRYIDPSELLGPAISSSAASSSFEGEIIEGDTIVGRIYASIRNVVCTYLFDDQSKL